ncbi:MAG: ABC transporter substrate-binding protein, partial [Bacteroidetes bacterium]|nr:ABC transporter substrate-binding protein [Bacteroidota bacterium]
MKFLIQLFLVILILSCSRKQDQSNGESTSLNSKTKYATNFKSYDNKLVVTEPWPGAVKPITYTLDKVPDRIVVTSTTYLPYLEMLGVEDRLVGFPGTKYISSPKIRKLVDEGAIMDLGPDGNMNLELLLSLEPDAVFAFDMGNESSTLDKIQEAGIPVVYNADFLETSTLGRAEWIKFYGAFFHQEEKADSIFSSIATAYDSLKNLVKNVKERPTILTGVMYGDAWFLPGGNNWSAAFYKDAGGKYIWEENPANGWIEVSFETV